MMEISLFHLNNSRSQRIIWLLEELSLSYKIIPSHSVNTVNIPDMYLPLKYPTIEIKCPDSSFFLTESSAILEFFSQRYPDLNPQNKDLKKMADFLFWKNFADASFMPNLVLKQIFGQIVQKTPLLFRPISWGFKTAFNKGYLDKAITEQLIRIEQHLSHNDWFAGDEFSILDILLWFPLQVCQKASKEFNYQNINRYLVQIHNRPAFQRSLIKGNWSENHFMKYWQSAW